MSAYIANPHKMLASFQDSTSDVGPTICRLRGWCSFLSSTLSADIRVFLLLPSVQSSPVQSSPEQHHLGIYPQARRQDGLFPRPIHIICKQPLVTHVRLLTTILQVATTPTHHHVKHNPMPYDNAAATYIALWVTVATGPRVAASSWLQTPASMCHPSSGALCDQ